MPALFERNAPYEFKKGVPSSRFGFFGGAAKLVAKNEKIQKTDTVVVHFNC